MKNITPCLWFNNNAEEAMNFYVSVFKNSKAKGITHAPEGSPTQAGSVLTVEFELDGQEFIGLNGGTDFPFSEAVSFSVHCEKQEEIDELWEKLTADGGEESQCGWLKDKFGLSWQIVPRELGKMLSDKDAAKAQRVMQAMLQMQKIDIAELKKAYEQE